MWFHKKDKFPYKEGLVQAALLVGYIAAIGIIFRNGDRLFGNKPDTFWGPVTMLTLFVTSALISGLIVFYQPYQLFLAGKGREAAKLVIATVKWLLVAFILLFTVMVIW